MANVIWDWDQVNPAHAKFARSILGAVDQAVGNTYTKNDLDTAVAEIRRMGLPWIAGLICSLATGAPVDTSVPDLLDVLTEQERETS